VTDSKPSNLKADVDDIITRQTFQTWVAPDPDPHADGVDVYRRSRKGELHKVQTVSTEERARRKGGFEWDVEVPALIDQLERLRGGTAASKVEMSSGRRTPSSRPPAGADIAELLIDMTTGAAGFYREALISLNRAQETVRRGRNGVRVDFAPDLRRTLSLLVDVIDDIKDEALKKRIERSVRSWKNAARLLLSHNAPMASLEMPCPVCKQQSLIVRSDASSDVICSNDECKDENGNQVRWPKLRWALLLEQSS
jgi:hypothetical protein